jgi:hypothetical protein
LSNERKPQAPGRSGQGRWIGIAAYLCAALVGVVLLFSGVAKAIRIEDFAEAVADLHLGSFHPVPEGWSGPLAYLAVLVEVALGVLLLMGHRGRAVIGATTALLLFFIGVTALQWIGGTEGGCGCFGAIVERSPKEEFFWDLGYLALLLPALLTLVLPALDAARPRRSASPGWTVATAGLIGLALGSSLVLAGGGPWLPAHQIETRISPLVPGATVPEIDPRASLETILPELWREPGPSLVVMTSFAEGPTLSEQTILRLNELAAARGFDLALPLYILVSAESAEGEEPIPGPEGQGAEGPEADGEEEGNAGEERYLELYWEHGLNLDNPMAEGPSFLLAREDILQYYDVQWSLRGRLDPDEPVPDRLLREPASLFPRSYWIEEGSVRRIWDGVPSLAEVGAASAELESMP